MELREFILHTTSQFVKDEEVFADPNTTRPSFGELTMQHVAASA
jgi:hypothetical protein